VKNEISSEIVKKYGLEAGAAVVGIASAGDFGPAPEGHRPSDVMEGCLSVIVLGVPFPKEALSMDTEEYTANRNEILGKMTEMAKVLAKRIKKDGYKAKDISASGGRFVEGKHYGHISLKNAAELAGIGVITRNYLLTSPEYGNLLWFSAVLTDAELAPDEKAEYGFCDNCNKCVEACPSGAIDDPAVFDTKKCTQFFTMVNKKFEIKCFKCRAVCPYRFGK